MPPMNKQMAGKTVLSATMMAAPIATTTLEWPRDKKKPNGRGLPVRSAGVIAVNDGRTIAPMRGDPDTVKPDMMPS